MHLEMSRKLRPWVAAAALTMIVALVATWFYWPPQPLNDAEATSQTADEASPTSIQLAGSMVRAAGIEVSPVTRRDCDQTIKCTGSVSFNLNKCVRVGPKADGILRSLNVDVGARVRAGDILAVVNSQTVGELKAGYIKGLIHEEHLRWQVARYKEAGEAIATKNLAETQHLLEEQVMDTARNTDRLRSYGLSTAELNGLVKAKDMGVALNVVTPLSGTVVERHGVEGEPAETTKPLFTVTDLGTLWLQLHIYESHARDLRVEQRVTFYPDGLPGESFDGTVRWISPQIDPQTRTIQVRAEIANRDEALRANMYGRAELHVEAPRKRLGVPPSAVQEYRGGHVVFIAEPHDRFAVRRVELGLKEPDFWEVISGVAPGERVATVGSFLLKSNLENPEFGSVE